MTLREALENVEMVCEASPHYNADTVRALATVLYYSKKGLESVLNSPVSYEEMWHGLPDGDTKL